jgi:hypothetical protein
VSDQPQGPGWWQASDGKYYPPEAAASTPGSSDPTAGGPWSSPGGAAYQHGPYAYGAQPPKQGTNGMAVASLVCSVLGLCCWVTAVAGIVLGHIALSQLNQPDNHESGRGLAIAGLAVGYGVVALGVLWVVFVIAFG